MGLNDFIMGIMVKKGIKSAVKLIISAASSVAIVQGLATVGIKFDINPVELEAGLTLLINTGLEMLRNYFKQKGVKWLA